MSKRHRMRVRDGVRLLVLIAAAAVLWGCGAEERAGEAAGIGATRRGDLPEFSSRDPIADSPVQYFLAADGAAAAQGYIRSDGGPFEILEFGPQGELPTEVRRPTVFVVFSQPMVPLTRLGQRMSQNALMQIEPELPGTFRWMGSRILSFQPDLAMDAQLEYRVTVPADAPALTGQQLGQAFSFSFFREPLDFVGMFPGSPESETVIDPDDAPPAVTDEITVLFTYPVDMEFIQEYLRVRVEGAPESELPFSLRRPTSGEPRRIERTVVLQLEQELPVDSTILVELLPGARSRQEYRGRTETAVRRFHTLRPFRFRSAETYSRHQVRSPAADANPVFLRFSHPLADQDWNEVLRVDLPVADLNPHVDLYGDTLRLSDLPVAYDSSYTIELLSGLADIHGRPLALMPVGRTRVVEDIRVDVPPASSYFYTPNRGSRMLEAAFPPRIIFELQNPEHGVWRVDAIDDPFAGFPPGTLEPYDDSHIKPNTKHFEVVDLAGFLNEDGFGSVGVAWNFAPRQDSGAVQTNRQVNLQLQVTDMGVTARYAHNQVLVWVRSLSSGEPVADARVQIYNYTVGGRREDRSAWTDHRGLAVFPLDAGEYRRLFADPHQRDRLELEVTAGTDQVRFRPVGAHNAYRAGIFNQISPAEAGQSRPVPFVFTDRGLYRPGEDLTYRIIDRNLTEGQYSVYSGLYQMTLREDSWRSDPLVTMQGQVGGTGGAYRTLQLPADLEPGDYVLEYQRRPMERPQRTRFQVAHFRRAAFAVAVSTPPQTMYHGDRLSLGIHAEYLSGGAVAGGELQYSWTRHPAAFAPPGTAWQGYAFGPRGLGSARVVDAGSDVLDSAGRAVRSLDTARDGIVGRAYTYVLEARVQDPARQELAGRGSVLVHPASFYLGARVRGSAGQRFIPAGQEAELAIAAVNVDGELADAGGSAGPVGTVQVEWIRRSWQSAQQRGMGGNLNTRYQAVEEVVAVEDATLRNGRARLSWRPPEAGQYIVRLSAVDAQDREVVTEHTFYATGSQWVRWLSSQSDEITLVPDREVYEVGDTARILVQAPLPKGQYLLTVERDGILEHSMVDIEGAASVIELEITEEHLPVVYVALSTSSERAEPPVSYFEPDLGKPRGFFGITALEVSPETRRLDVEVFADQEVYRPASEAEVRVRVTHNGQPVAGAEVTLLGVDRGVLDLIDYRIPDPLEYFYNRQHFPLGVRGDDSRRLLIDPVAYDLKDLQGGGGEDAGKLDQREDFRPLAVFAPYLLTDQDGEATVSFTWPDSLTTYRLTAVAIEPDRFGKQEHEVAVQNPLTVRTALPQQLRVRDTASAGVILTNQTEAGLEVELQLDIEGSDSPQSYDSQLLRLQPGETAEARFLLAFDTPGTRDLTFTVRSDVVNEQLRTTLPVVESSVREAFTLAGGLPFGDSEEAVVLPRSILPESGELEVRFTALPIDFLREPFRRWLRIEDERSLEMLVYRAAPYALFGDDLGYLLSDQEAAQARQGAEQLFTSLGMYQHRDGGFVYEPQHRRSEHPSPVRTTLLGAEAAGWLRRAGFPEPAELQYSLMFNRLRELTVDDQVAPFERAWALLLLSELYSLPGYRSQLAAVAGLEDSLGAAGYALGTVAAGNLNQERISARAFDRLRNLLQIGTRSVDMVETYETRNYFDSTLLRLSAVYLAYIEREPDSVAPPRILAAMNRAGLHNPWINSIDLLWAARAAAAARDRSVGAHTPLQVSASLAGQELLSEQLSTLQQSPVSQRFALHTPPLAALERGQVHPLQLSLGDAAGNGGAAGSGAGESSRAGSGGVAGSGSRAGSGDASSASGNSADGPAANADNSAASPVFYSATLSYALPDEIVSARDEGFSLFRTLEDLSGNTVSPEELQRGETYRISVTLGSDRYRYNAYMRIPVPSGMEVLDGSLSTTGTFAEAGGTAARSWIRETAYGETREYLDEGHVRRTPRGLYLQSLQPTRRLYPGEVTYRFPHLYPGSQTVTFLVRAVTPGVFPWPPAEIELEGEEEVFGRTDGTLAIIE
ncbi:alpha-2-macroglobulin family protein [Spirochaeta africana]|uniref:Large extracellular alpha-helical protein n=1 Tax=Spirochaeta africana (strain ATCC 700263 / DSM 8902 / Z-7692) TaxID=889378 RepID=H9UGB0_SPIAZ|nr:alpha-2-macroglobulin family protein [Spirochaeta africana]AFG36553.1 large extracellular alpha-helical protein [Spirochaeta africana DSM 8902]